jgi:hypothetical protein
MPAFIFVRQPSIEKEAGFVLAGMLILPGLPKTAKPNKKLKRFVNNTIQSLKQHRARMGEVTLGWHGGIKPDDAADLDAAAINQLGKTRMVVGVRIDPRHDGYMRIDSAMRRILDLPSIH